MIYRRTFEATRFKMPTQQADLFIRTYLRAYDGRVTDTHLNKHTEERVAIV